MKSLRNALMIMLVGIIPFLTGCSQTVDPGSVGVLVYKPYLFGQGGVDNTVVQPGRVFTALTTELVQYSTRPVQIDEQFTDLITTQNVPVSFDSYIQFHIIAEKAGDLHQKFGTNAYTDKLKQPFRTMVRDFARAHTVFELTTDAKITSEGQDAILKEIVKLVQKDNIPIVIDNVVIGAVRPPKEVLEETSRTQAQQQRVQTENARATAELSRAHAEENKAIADKGYATKFGMTAQEFLAYRRIENQREIIEIVKDKKDVNVLLSLGGMGGSEAVMPNYPMK